MPDRMGHEWKTQWNSTQTMLVSQCQWCGAVEKTSENGKVWMSPDIDPFKPCQGKDETYAD
jgi:hypothetical protein